MCSSPRLSTKFEVTQQKVRAKNNIVKTIMEVTQLQQDVGAIVVEGGDDAECRHGERRQGVKCRDERSSATNSEEPVDDVLG